MKKLAIFFMAFGIFLSVIPIVSHAGYSHGPRQTGEEILLELLMGSSRFIVSVGSGGCTSKDFFKVDVKKEEGLSAIAPHYVLTIIRTKPDECKAIVDDGTLILFDMEKDLGIKGNYTYSLTNHVYSSSRAQMWDESLLSVIEKHFALTNQKSGK
jgi:hypothetical protein